MILRHATECIGTDGVDGLRGHILTLTALLAAIAAHDSELAKEDLLDRLRRDYATYRGTLAYSHSIPHFDDLQTVAAEMRDVRQILAHTDIGSLPNDFTLRQLAEARIDDLIKRQDQGG